MQIPKFNEKEMNPIGEMPDLFGGLPIKIYDFPISGKQAVKMLYNKQAPWQMILGQGTEFINFSPKVNPDAVARAFVVDATVIHGETNTSAGKDMFGVEWQFESNIGGSMVFPGNPMIKDANELKSKIVWPDVDSWEWEEASAVNKDMLSGDQCVYLMFMNGYFERLISLMDFNGAIVAMIDEDQQEAVKAFFDKLTDLYINIFEHYFKYFPQIDVVNFHDDWGAQKDTFFSPVTAEEMIVPYMKRVVDFIHSKDRFVDLHSCGNNIKQVPNYIKAGFDSWTPQAMNDSRKIYEMYGDQIIIGVLPDVFDGDTVSEEEQREFAKAYASEYCSSEKPSTLSMYANYGNNMLTPAFREEVYRQSRIEYTRNSKK